MNIFSTTKQCFPRFIRITVSFTTRNFPGTGKTTRETTQTFRYNWLTFPEPIFENPVMEFQLLRPVHWKRVSRDDYSAGRKVDSAGKEFLVTIVLVSLPMQLLGSCKVSDATWACACKVSLPIQLFTRTNPQKYHRPGFTRQTLGNSIGSLYKRQTLRSTIGWPSDLFKLIDCNR